MGLNIIIFWHTVSITSFISESYTAFITVLTWTVHVTHLPTDSMWNSFWDMFPQSEVNMFLGVVHSVRSQ